MATNFPSSLDSFTNPSATDAMDSVTVPHADQHADVNDAVEALQAKVGVDGSADASSLDYKVANQGLTLVKTQNMTTGSTSATVTNAFSSDFRNYRIIITGGSGTLDGSIQMRLGTETTGYYSNLAYITYGGSGWTVLNDSNASQFSFVGSTRTTCINLACDIYSPFAGARTVYESTYLGAKTTSVTGFTGGFHNANTSFSDVTFILEYGQVQFTPTIRVYGYNNG